MAVVASLSALPMDDLCAMAAYLKVVPHRSSHTSVDANE
jgi:hypothetical protein